MRNQGLTLAHEDSDQIQSKPFSNLYNGSKHNKVTSLVSLSNPAVRTTQAVSRGHFCKLQHANFQGLDPVYSEKPPLCLSLPGRLNGSYFLATKFLCYGDPDQDFMENWYYPQALHNTCDVFLCYSQHFIYYQRFQFHLLS